MTWLSLAGSLPDMGGFNCPGARRKRAIGKRSFTELACGFLIL